MIKGVTDPPGRVSVALSFEHTVVADSIASDTGENKAIENAPGDIALAGHGVSAGASATHGTMDVRPAPPLDLRTEVRDAHAAADEQIALLVNTKVAVQSAHDVVERKPVILDKLGKARKIVDLILKAGDYVGEVSLYVKCAVVAFSSSTAHA